MATTLKLQWLQFGLRNLLIVAILGPPLLAGAWLLGATVVREYRRQNQSAKDAWEDIGGPGSIAEFSVNIQCEMGADEADHSTVEETPPAGELAAP